ncbi:MAG: DUF2911 domain-containing protein [Candidatus Eisenbacteria bacterium]
MKAIILRLLCSAMFVLSATCAFADESGHFVVRLGSDTTSVERFVRGKDRLTIDQVGRAPRTLRRRFTYEYQQGALKRLSTVFGPPGSSTPTQTIDAFFDADSMRAQIKNGSNAPQDLRVALPSGALVIFSTSPWSLFEGAIQQLVKSRRDTLGGVLYYMGATAPERYLLRRLGRDSVEISNTHGDLYHAATDKAGHITGTLPIAGTAKFAIERVAALDLDAMGAAFLAREQSGAGVGTLSPRDSVKVASAGGAAISIDYGRPAKRGRAVFGGIVPYGEVWRTGANAATQFKTDRALDFGGITVPAGAYTLWTIPSATGWKLVFNSQTGQWGTQHDASKDVFTVPMTLTALPEVVERFTIGVSPSDSGGTLMLDWDTTRASAAFTTRP